MAKKKKFYVVWQGHTPGIYDNWTDCQLQIKSFPGAKYKSFGSLGEAEAAFNDNYTAHYKQQGTAKKVAPIERNLQNVEWKSIAVDAACSGNPGKMEYQGVDTKTGDRIFHQAFPMGTNNIGEFLALVHGLAHLQREGSDLPIYTDSKIAMGWIRQKKCKTQLKRTASTQKLYEVIARAEKWLASNTWSNKILKWDTDNWGEIPADFGRK